MPTSKEQRILGGLVVRPTDLSSRQLREHPSWAQRVRDEALFSARTTYEKYLEMLKEKLQAVASRSITPQKAEEQLQQALENIGYTPRRGFPGNKTVPPAAPRSMEDLGSSRRIQLILDTNIKKARSLGQMAAGEDPVFLAANPAWRLTRTGARKKPRGDWRERWAKAGASVAWKGASKKDMVALKDSPIWEALGKGVGGYEDTVGSPFPPFAFGSGLAWVNVGRREWERICRSEGIPFEQPKAPSPSSAGKVPMTEEEKKNSPVPRQDLPDYAQSKEFQDKLREALQELKENRLRRQEDDEISRTDRPNLPSFGDYAGNVVYRVRERVFEFYRQIQRRLNFVSNIKLRYYEKCLKDSNGGLSEESDSRLRGIIEEVRKAVFKMTSYERYIRGYMDRLQGEHGKVSDDMARRYESSAQIMANRAEEYYLRERNRDIVDILSEVRLSSSKDPVISSILNQEKGHPELSQSKRLSELKSLIDSARREGDEKKAEEAYRSYVEEADRLWKPQTELERRTSAAMSLIGAVHTVGRMSVETQTNPNYNKRENYRGEWTWNCQRCVPTAEMISRGWKVTAMPKPRGRGIDSLALFSFYQNIFVGGTKMSWKTKEDIESKMREWGDGSRAMIACPWKGSNGNGHYFFAEQRDGSTVFICPQSGKVGYSPWKNIPTRGIWTKNKTFMRIDNLEFNPSLVEKIAKPVD